MLKTLEVTGTVHTHTHTQAYLENKIKTAYKVCFNNNARDG